MGAVGWGLCRQSFDEGVAATSCATLGVAALWTLYAIVEACLWLRKKLLEGDEFS